MIYLFCFAISCLLIWLGEKGKNNFVINKIIFLLALIIPAVLAGVRDFTVGCDVLYYGNPVFYDVLNRPSTEGMDPKWEGWIEPGYIWFNFVVTRFFDDVRWFYFLIMLLQNAFTFLGFYFYKDKISIWLGMLCYYCFFFCFSLNVIRECFAMSMLFFASRYLLNKSYIKYFIWILITFFFHKAAIIAFLLIPLHAYVSKFERDKTKFIIFIISTIILININFILNVSLEILQLDYLSKALWYIAGQNDYEGLLKLAIVNFILFTPPFIFFLWKREKLYSFGKENHFLFVIAFICMLSTQLIHFGGYVVRVLGVFRWLLLLTLPMIPVVYKNLPNKQFLLKIFIIIYAFCHWLVLIRRNNDEIYPYTSSILNSIF